MDFAMHLVDNGVISCSDLFEALKLQRRTRAKIGALAIEARKLNCRQVFKVLEAQIDEPGAHFGEVAVRLGLLSEADFALLLGEQLLRTAPLRDVLVEAGFISEEQAAAHYLMFRNESGRPVLESAAAPRC